MGQHGNVAAVHVVGVGAHTLGHEVLQLGMDGVVVVGHDVPARLRAPGGAVGDPALASRTWVLLTEAPDGGWGLGGHANTNEELVAAARAQIASLQAGKPADK